MTTSGDTPGFGGAPGGGYGTGPSGSPGSPAGGGHSGGYGGGVPTSGAPQVGAPTPEPARQAGPPRSEPREPRTEPRRPEPRPAPSGSSTAATAQPLRSGKARRARLVVRRIDPWSVLKFTLLFSLCLLIVFVVAVAALFFALDALGVFESVNDFVRDLTQANSGGRRTGGVEVPFTASRVIGVATVIGLINVVLITAISTLGAFLYNLCADIVGGIELTLAERE